MLKQMINFFQVDLILKNTDPLLIKSGLPSVEGIDAAPIKTYYPGEMEALPVIPGSSIKGVFRSHLEKIVSTIDPDNHTLVCIPYEVAPDARKSQWKKKSNQSSLSQIFCGEKIKFIEKNNRQIGFRDTFDPPFTYKLSCPMCRLFGSTYFKGRLGITDGYLTEKGKKEHSILRRDGIAIDRFTGGTAPEALFQSEVVVEGEFKVSINLKNFEAWQLGGLFLLIRDLMSGEIRLGSGTSRGLGLVKGEIASAALGYIRTLETFRDFIPGIGRWPGAAESYGLFKEDQISLKELTKAGGEAWLLPEPRLEGIRKVFSFAPDTEWEPLLQQGINLFLDKMEQWQEIRKRDTRNLMTMNFPFLKNWV